MNEEEDAIYELAPKGLFAIHGVCDEAQVIIERWFNERQNAISLVAEYSRIIDLFVERLQALQMLAAVEPDEVVDYITETLGFVEKVEISGEEGN